MPAVYINGSKVEAKDGATILQAALDAGIYIPHLCHHPDLEPAGICRLCLVEVEGRGIVASCQAQVEDGMAVWTETPMVQKARQISLELLLTNHLGDCLSCPKDNECKLQEVASYIGINEERFKQLRMLAPQFPLDESNPFFLRDPNRCVLCGICVRTCDEIQGIGAINYAFRGFATTIATFGNKPIVESNCESCGECVVRCPTGALVPKNYRKPAKEVKSICPYCGVGCSIYLGVRGNEVVFVRGDKDSPVNEGQLCVKGRFGFGFINSPERLRKPLVKRNGEFVEVTWDEALDLVASKFSQYKGDQFAAVASARCTNEENYLVQKFARAVMQTNNVDNCARLCHAPTVAGLNIAYGTGGGTNPISDIDGASCIFVIGSNTTVAHPVVGTRIRRAARRGATLIVADPRRIELFNHAHVCLQQRPGSDVALLMGMARVIYEQGLHDEEFIRERCENFEAFVESLEQFELDFVEEVTNVPKEKIIQAATLYATRKPSLIIYSLGITEHSHGAENVLALANLAMLTGNVGKPSAGVMPLRGQNNVQGACDMGCIPASFPGYQPVKDGAVRRKFEKAWGCRLSEKPGLTLVEMFQEALKGNVRAFYIVGMDLAYSMPNARMVWEALERAEFVVVQEILMTGTAKFAHVILPGASFAEKDGTFTNLERRVQLIRKAIEPIGDARPDWWITCEIAKRMGATGFDYSHPSEVMDEIARLTPSFAGMSFARLEGAGIQWPCTSPDHPGTPILHIEAFNTPTGKGHFSPLQYKPPAEMPDDEYPLILTTGRSLYHFHLSMTRRVEGLLALHPEERIWLNPKDASKLGIADGDKVKVISRRGEVFTRAKVTEDVAPGTAFMTFHFYETPTNILVNEALCPIAKTPEFKVTAIRVERA
ncbi:MAG: formate dehydrogenase subunit alpha [Armatimonadota bacterium]|nr:formate dehydrogenase subunit alpha [Armatimonadota bacterium]MCX7777166.1 formate dehydrogenase subunit alpha [Armatimonadota bacterium]MDW8024993.1 formate dehydrogenase subunit alpha [Armatimonadota bacterium]